MTEYHTSLRLVRAGVDTYQQPVVYMHKDCHVCRSEGFAALTRVKVRCDDREIIATLNVVLDDKLPLDVAALSEAAWKTLQPGESASGEFSHAEPAASTPALRAKVFGERLDQAAFLAIMRDAINNRLSDIELAAFVTACAGDRLDIEETIALTRAMVAVGEKIDWGAGAVLDKQSDHPHRGRHRGRSGPSYSEDVVACNNIARRHGGYNGGNGASSAEPQEYA
jgi:thymidine phosphorylase